MRPMKDSGVEWIGDIPENWDVHFVKYAFSEVKNKNYDDLCIAYRKELRIYGKSMDKHQ